MAHLMRSPALLRQPRSAPRQLPEHCCDLRHDGSSYTTSHWSDDGKTIYSSMAPLWAGTGAPLPRPTVLPQMDQYVRCWAPSMCRCAWPPATLADFVRHTVVENGGQLRAATWKRTLTAYTLTAAVDENTNGLKYATKSGDGYTFSAAHTGTGSGVAEAAQKAGWMVLP